VTVPGWFLSGFGPFADIAQRGLDTRLPWTGEGIWVMNRAARCDNSKTRAEFALEAQSLRATFADTVRWLVQVERLTAREAGRLAEPRSTSAARLGCTAGLFAPRRPLLGRLQPRRPLFVEPATSFEEVAQQRELVAFVAAQPGTGSLERAVELATQPIVLRTAQPSDAAALGRFATLDCAPTPAGQVLLAEVEGELRAVVSVETGAAVADPFRPTADLVDLLAARAKTVRRSTVVLGGAPGSYGCRSFDRSSEYRTGLASAAFAVVIALQLGRRSLSVG
jgi:hypothetical protein